MTKGERLCKDMKTFELGEGDCMGERLEMDMDKKGATLEATLKNVRGSKFLDKRSTQVGGASS
jgi:hypothetical protein